jgi:CDP-glycerol glycerophosphotransferase (TagB/SpsB family)
MKLAYYAANLQGLTWVKPVHDLTGGTLCTDREKTFVQAREEFPSADLKLFDAGTKWSLRRARGEQSPLLSRRPAHLPLARVARELDLDVVVTTANFAHHIRRDGIGALLQGGAMPRVKQVQMFHGISSKNNKFKPFMAHYDLLLFVGERDKQRFEKMGVLQKTRWKLVGLPRSDRIARGELKRETTLQNLGLDETKPTVLYAPTHSALSSFFDWGLDVCRAAPRECNLIVKPHPLIGRAIESGSADASTWNAIENYLSERGAGVLLAAQADIQQLMVAADLLVTDFSSAAEEFLIFNRPLVFANHLANGGYYLGRGEWDGIHSVGEVVADKTRLASAVADALSAPETFQAQRERMRDFVFYKVDGLAAQRAETAICEVAV